MATAPTTTLPLPMPAQPDCKFSNIIFNASIDPFNGGYGDLLSNFEIDPNNVNTGVTPANLRDYIAAAGSQRIPLALGLFVEGLFKVYICPYHFDRAMPPLLPSIPAPLPSTETCTTTKVPVSRSTIPHTISSPMPPMYPHWPPLPPP